MPRLPKRSPRCVDWYRQPVDDMLNVPVTTTSSVLSSMPRECSVPASTCSSSRCTHPSASLSCELPRVRGVSRSCLRCCGRVILAPESHAVREGLLLLCYCLRGRGAAAVSALAPQLQKSAREKTTTEIRININIHSQLSPAGSRTQGRSKDRGFVNPHCARQ